MPILQHVNTSTNKIARRIKPTRIGYLPQTVLFVGLSLLWSCSSEKTVDLQGAKPARIVADAGVENDASGAPTACKFNIYSTEHTVIRDRVTLTPGNVGSAQFVEVGVEAQVRGTIISSANVLLRDRSTAHQIFAAGSITKQNQVTITGEEVTGLQIPVENIEVRQVPTGTEHRTLTSGQQLALAPGTYGDMILRGGATLSLTEGVYNFRKLILEAGTASLQLAPGTGVIEVNAQQEMRFGDRNQFILEKDAYPAQVQFYTNSTAQVKVGTDSVFNGVITAPNAQIYVFSRVDFNGAMYGKQIWIDTDSRVNLHSNCGANNMANETQILMNICDAMGFEGDPWSPVGSLQTAVLKNTGLFASAGYDSLEISLHAENQLEVDAPVGIQLPFGADGDLIEIKVDVLSTSVPFSDWGAMISLQARAEGDASYQQIGVFPYAPGESGQGSFLAIGGHLPEELSVSVRQGQALHVRIGVSSTQPDATFWLDNLRLCSNADGCNPGCPDAGIGAETVPEPVSTDLELRFEDDNLYLATGRNGISGSITNTTQNSISGLSAILTFLNAFGEMETRTVYTGTIEGEQTIDFAVDAAQIPFVDEHMVNQVILRASGDQGDSPLPIESSLFRYYRHETSSGTIAHFGSKAFTEVFGSTLYHLPAIDLSMDTDAPQNPITRIRFAPYTGSTEDTDSDIDTEILIE